MKKIRFFTAVAAVLMMTVFPACAAGGDYMSEKAEVRIQNVMAKIRRGEPVTIATMGGSITTGFAANPINQNSWAAKTGDWFKKLGKECGSEVTFLNEGVSGTDSAFGAARVKDHIVNNKVDLVVLEFAMNDQWLGAETRQRTYEGVIRQIMNGTDTAILALFVNERKAPYSGQQYEQQPICEYYHIPFVSWKDEVLAKNSSGSDFEKFFDGTETVHPNNEGHASIAGFIIEKLEGYWKALPADKKIPSPVKKLPAAKTDTSFEFAKYYHNGNIKPLSNTGWEADSPVHSEWVQRGKSSKGWQSTDVNGELTFEVEGTSIGICYSESDQFRNAQAWVTLPDGTDSEKVSLACLQVSRKGYLGWAYKQIVDSDVPQKYILHVKVAKRAPKSAEGKYANIIGILAGGAKK